MNRIHLAPWITLIALAVAGCEKAAPPEEPFPQAAADGWVAAFNSGDAEGLALMYTADANVLPPDQPIVSGAAAIGDFWTTFNPGNVRIAISEAETMKLGEYWFREGTFTGQYPNEGEPRVGKFIELWKKVGSAWLLHRHMWSSNAPSTPPPITPPA